jgi:group I intron endonuclease
MSSLINRLSVTVVEYLRTLTLKGNVSMDMYKQTAIIYMATNNITKLSYIGFTSCQLNHRIKEHQYDSNRSDTHFYRAAKKYGWNSFDWYILYESWDKEHCLNVMEPYFIKEYDTYENGYNSTFGGDGLSTKHMKDRWNKEDSPYRTQNYINKQSNAIKQLHSSVDSPYKTKSYIEKQKRTQTEKYGKEFIAISPDGSVYYSKGLKEFCRTHNLTHQCAGAVLNGHKPSHKGWTFKKSY